MSIVKKLDQILTHVDGVLSADREQNVKILGRQIKDELASNNDKTMADLLNAIKPKKYVMYFLKDNIKFYVGVYQLHNKTIQDAKIYYSLESISNAINSFSKSMTGLKFNIEEVRPSIGFSDFNDFHENC